MWRSMLALAVAATTWSCDSPGGGTGTGGGGAAPDLVGEIDWGDAPNADTLADTADTADTPAPDAVVTPDNTPDLPKPSDADAPEPDPIDPPDEGPPPDTGPGPDELGGGVLVSEVDSDFFEVAGAGARFTDPQPPATGGTAYGDCVATAFTPNIQLPEPFGYDAGTISVTGTLPPVTLTPINQGAKGTGYGSSLPEEQTDLLPGGGALITIKGIGGADIGPFTLVAQTPEPVAITNPLGGLGMTLGTGGAAMVSWNAGIGDEVTVLIVPLDGSYQPMVGQQLLCTYGGDSGSAIMPAAALAAVRGSSSAQNVAFAVTRVKTHTAAAGDLTVTATITRSAGTVLQLVP